MFYITVKYHDLNYKVVMDMLTDGQTTDSALSPQTLWIWGWGGEGGGQK